MLVLDDALKGHEQGGYHLARRLPLPDLPGLRERDVGELLAWAAVGAAVTLSLVFAHRASPSRAKADSWWLAGLVGVLMVFAVGVDMVHIAVSAVTSSPVVELVVTCAEAAGEVSAMAALLVYTVHVVRRGSAEPDLNTGSPRTVGALLGPMDAKRRT